MSIEEERAFLEQYRQLAEQGHILDIREIEKAYAEKVGHNIGSGQIYRVLQRHGWRKVLPRSKHRHHIREYRYVYGAVEPFTGESCFLVMPYCNTACMNLFLNQLSKQYPDDMILLCCDGAAWHKSGSLCVPENIRLFFIPPYTPEMNPIEQIWKELRKRGFRNEVFATLEKVVDHLCDTICALTSDTIRSITARPWVLSCFY